MATNKLPGFLINNPKREVCTGRLASLAHQLLSEGYSPRHIAWAATIVADDYAAKESLDIYRRFLKFNVALADDNLKATQPFVTWEEPEHGDKQLEFLESL